VNINGTIGGSPDIEVCVDCFRRWYRWIY